MSVNKFLVVCSPSSATTTNYFKVSDGILWMGADATELRPLCRKQDVFNWKKNTVVAETLAADTLLFAGTGNSVQYEFVITQYDSEKQVYKSIPVFYETPSTGTVTATLTANAVEKIIEASAFKGTVTNDAAGTLTLTAATGYSTYTITLKQMGGGITHTAHAGAVAYGLDPYVALVQAGMKPADIPASTGGYVGYTFSYAPLIEGQQTVSQASMMDGAFFINTDAAQDAALISAIDLLFP